MFGLFIFIKYRQQKEAGKQQNKITHVCLVVQKKWRRKEEGHTCLKLRYIICSSRFENLVSWQSVSRASGRKWMCGPSISSNSLSEWMGKKLGRKLIGQSSKRTPYWKVCVCVCSHFLSKANDTTLCYQKVEEKDGKNHHHKEKKTSIKSITKQRLRRGAALLAQSSLVTTFRLSSGPAAAAAASASIAANTLHDNKDRQSWSVKKGRKCSR